MIFIMKLSLPVVGELWWWPGGWPCWWSNRCGVSSCSQRLSQPSWLWESLHRGEFPYSWTWHWPQIKLHTQLRNQWNWGEWTLMLDLYRSNEIFTLQHNVVKCFTCIHAHSLGDWLKLCITCMLQDIFSLITFMVMRYGVICPKLFSMKIYRMKCSRFTICNIWVCLW